LVAILPWTHSHGRLEATVELGDGLKAACEGDFSDGLLGMAQGGQAVLDVNLVEEYDAMIPGGTLKEQ